MYQKPVSRGEIWPFLATAFNKTAVCKTCELGAVATSSEIRSQRKLQWEMCCGWNCPILTVRPERGTVREVLPKNNKTVDRVLRHILDFQSFLAIGWRDRWRNLLRRNCVKVATWAEMAGLDGRYPHGRRYRLPFENHCAVVMPRGTTCNYIIQPTKPGPCQTEDEDFQAYFDGDKWTLEWQWALAAFFLSWSDSLVFDDEARHECRLRRHCRRIQHTSFGKSRYW